MVEVAVPLAVVAAGDAVVVVVVDHAAGVAVAVEAVLLPREAVHPLLPAPRCLGSMFKWLACDDRATALLVAQLP